MKLARNLTLAAVGAGSLTALLLTAQGCSSSSSVTTTNSSSSTSSNSSSNSSNNSSATSSTKTTGTSSSSATVAGGGTPPPSMGTPTTSTTEHNFAIHNLWLGDTDETDAFTANTAAWKTIGYNLDGLDTTTGTATNTCSPHVKNQGVVDGADGIDNAFGDVIVSALVSTLSMNLSQLVSQKIAAGSFTILLDTKGLDTTTTQTNTALGGQLFAGGTYDGTPPLTGTSFSVTDNWPVSPALLTDGMTIAGGSKISFGTGSYVTAGTWVSGTPVNLSLSLSLEGESLTLTIHHAVISFQHTVDAAGQGHATNGVISGVLETTEFLQAINQVVGQISNGSDCALVGSVLTPIIDGAQDVIINPTSGDVSNVAGTPCNGISVGIGFDADEIAVPSTVAPLTDAGTALPACGASSSGSGSSTGSTSGSGSSSTTSTGSSSSSSTAN